MAEPTPAAPDAATLPDDETLSRAEAFAREPFVLPGEDPAEALAPGGARRRALDAALAEIAEGAAHPSTQWRRDFSMMLGLERVLSDEEPKLADGTQLNPHQVDALSGTLTALLAEAQRGANGAAAAPAPAPAAGGNGAPPAEALASPAIPGDDEEALEEVLADVPDDEEPLDWDAEKEADDEQLPGGARGPERAQALLVRARDRRRQDRRRRWASSRRRAPAASSSSPTAATSSTSSTTSSRHAATATGSPRRCSARSTTCAPTGPSPSRPTSGSCATRARSPPSTPWSSATRRTPRSARRRRRRSASGRARSSSA
jgi:hypothetical protein